ncbi:hypothetical protein PAAG_08413 [Paracoccidioides lutzii Pb01]|uniref:CCHC-type domain-containing protein n=1 Tax=Paracoccidioides lutzii (strain ATCC MYA-826 / Pb01) TaxID=502779 RepID=C1HCC2_PARBA|nr:hypothetical protein PAAG_08413 [Paracoccidioides lutzii Pb01]EEH38686.2 hypothetical protein PAAG_08413 [Paracoccidioides lutzii Pb01]
MKNLLQMLQDLVIFVPHWQQPLLIPFQVPVSLEEFRQAIHSDKNHIYKELAAIFDSIFDDEKMLRDTITHLRMEQNNITDQATVKQSQIDELIAECDELSHTLIHMTTAEEIFEHLKSIYENANKLQNVKSDYHKLIICNEDNYHEFITKFLHLADEVKIIKENYKTDFNDKLFFDLQRMMTVVNAIINIYAEFQKICAQAVHTLQTINATQKLKSLQGNESNIFKQNTLWASDSQTSHSTSATKSSIIKKALSAHSDIQCYYCKEKDHIARNCSMKQKSQQVITELTENDTSEPSADLRKE